MDVMLLLIVLAVLGWCVLSVPIAMVVGRAIKAEGHGPDSAGRSGYQLAA